MNIRNLFFAMLGANLLSCTPSDPTSAVDNIDYVDLKDIKPSAPLNLSSIADSIEYIALDTPDDALIHERPEIYVADSAIFVGTTGRLLLFDRKGKFVRSLIRMGQGPNEGMLLYGALYPEKQQLYMYNSQKRSLFVYDSKGNLLQSFRLPTFTENIATEDPYRSNSVPNIRNMCIYKYYLILINQNLKPFFFVYHIDAPIEPIYKHINTYTYPLVKPIVMYDSYSTNFQTLDDTLYFKEQFFDTLFYTADFKTFQPKYIIQWGNNKLTYKEWVSVISLQTPFQEFDGVGKYRILDFLLTSPYAFFWLQTFVSEQNVATYLATYNAKTKQTHVSTTKNLVNDIDGGVDFDPFYCRYVIDNKIGTVIYPENLINAFQENRPYSSQSQRNKLQKIVEAAKFDDNPILMILNIKP